MGKEQNNGLINFYLDPRVDFSKNYLSGLLAEYDNIDKSSYAYALKEIMSKSKVEIRKTEMSTDEKDEFFYTVEVCLAGGNTLPKNLKFNFKITDDNRFVVNDIYPADDNISVILN